MTVCMANSRLSLKFNSLNSLVLRSFLPYPIDRKQAAEWNIELGQYLERNNYYERAKEKAGLDTYFGDLKDAQPQIFGVYCSRPQVMARQAESMANTKRFLNGLWDTNAPAGPEFDPNTEPKPASTHRLRLAPCSAHFRDGPL